jgi:hypothetical protein
MNTRRFDEAPMPTPDPAFLIQPAPDEPLLAAVERGMAAARPPLHELPTLSDLVARDPYFAQQLAELHTSWAVTIHPGTTLRSRLRARLVGWLLGPEIAQINATHARLVRVIASLTSHLDDERAARLRREQS